jgi:hypothetical protein
MLNGTEKLRDFFCGFEFNTMPLVVIEADRVTGKAVTRCYCQSCG